jgi:hypothetical protein
MIPFLIQLAVLMGAIRALIGLVPVSQLSESFEKRCRNFIERWQASLSSPSLNEAFGVPFATLTKLYDRVFGTNLFSWQTFRKTCLFGGLFVTASMAGAGLLSGKPFAMNQLPWQSYDSSIQYLQILAKSPQIHHLAGDPFYLVQNSSDLARFEGWPYAVGFTVFFIAVVVISNALLVSVSISLSRLFLREMQSATSLFGLCVLLISNAALTLILACVAASILFILLNVWSWPLVPMLLSLSQLSVLAGAGVASVASLCSWFFSGTWLKVVVVGALLPSIIVATLIAIALVGIAFRPAYSLFANVIINLSLKSPKGIVTFYSAVLLFLAAVCGGLATVWSWLDLLNSKLGVSTIFGIDYVIVSFFCLLSMLVISLVLSKKAVVVSNLKLCFSDVLFLYCLSILVIGAGFFCEAFLACIFPQFFQSPTGLSSSLALPTVSSIIPGSIIGFFCVMSRLRGFGIFQLSLRILLVLVCFDIYSGLTGGNSFRDIAASIVCDFIGSPVAAISLLGISTFMVRLRKMNNKGIECSKIDET